MPYWRIFRHRVDRCMPNSRAVSLRADHRHLVLPAEQAPSQFYCCSGGGALISGFDKARSHFGKIKAQQIDATGADLVCTPCVNCFDAIDELAKHYQRFEAQ